MDGESNKILGLDCMHKPENIVNATAINLLLRLAHLLPKMKTLVYGRACSLHKNGVAGTFFRGLLSSYG